MSPPLLDAQVGCRRRDLDIDVPLTVQSGQLTALVGPNGAGKTTVLRALAGLLRLESGHVRLDGQVLSDPVTGRHVAPEERSVGFVFDDNALFPTMSARDNVAFGLRARGDSKAVARATAQQLLAAVGLADLASARPASLSGGQAQRVALARALAVRPRLLLLDEPFAALDQRVRAQLRSDVKRLVGEFAGGAVLVSHDAVDALVLADHVVVIEAGKVVQQGSPAELARRPRTEYVAALAGLNLLRGHAHGTTATVGATTVTLGEATHGDVLIAIRPTSIAVHREKPEGSPRNVWSATVTGVDAHGDQVRLDTTGALDVVVDVTAQAAAELRVVPGDTVWLSVKATETRAYQA